MDIHFLITIKNQTVGLTGYTMLPEMRFIKATFIMVLLADMMAMYIRILVFLITRIHTGITQPPLPCGITTMLPQRVTQTPIPIMQEVLEEQEALEELVEQVEQAAQAAQVAQVVPVEPEQRALLGKEEERVVVALSS
jgi:hypothetical protein